MTCRERNVASGPAMRETDGRVYDFPGLALELEAPSGRNLDGGAAAIAGALFELGAVLRPLSLEALLHVDGDPKSAHRSLFIVDESAATDGNLTLGPIYGAAELRQVDLLSPSVVEAALQEAFRSHRIEPGIEASWHQVFVRQTEARVPSSLADRDVMHLVEDGGGRDTGGCVHRRSDGNWVRACYGVEPPFTLAISELALTITGFWSLWMPGGPGAGDFAKALDGLVARGWSIVGANPHWGIRCSDGSST
jgi:hypothetical protein